MRFVTLKEGWINWEPNHVSVGKVDKYSYVNNGIRRRMKCRYEYRRLECHLPIWGICSVADQSWNVDNSCMVSCSVRLGKMVKAKVWCLRTGAI